MLDHLVGLTSVSAATEMAELRALSTAAKGRSRGWQFDREEIRSRS